jgi:hypothetical protein
MAKDTKKVWDNCELIGEVMKSPSIKLRVELVARDGIKYINIREWYIKKSENVWKPGLHGFAVPVAVPIDGAVQTPTDTLCDLIAKGLEKAPEFALEGKAVFY